MAQIVLSEAGAALGRRLLPQGLSWLGRTVTGAALGRAAGSLAGRMIDGHFAAPHEGPRIASLHVMGAAEGDGVASVYGRMRIGGQLIWASQFTERRRTERASKMGPRSELAAYSINFAVAIGEGPVVRIARAWANGEPFDLSGTVHRFYDGTEAQDPDPLIEMIEGSAPAYRGIAYIVFEDLPLESFGNRVPQLSFEVVRAGESSAETRLADCVTGVNIIPATGEFVYAPYVVSDLIRPGAERTLNVHTGEARADFLVSLDQLRSDLPRVSHVALTCAWFASGVDASTCEIRPGVETRDRITRPHAWGVAGRTRQDAHLVSFGPSGRANYGGTPSDETVIGAVRELKARGYSVTLTPFLLVDAEGFPWRGRITAAGDKTAAARTNIAAFCARTEGYRAFILHYAHLAAQAGGVDSFLIGSEMRGLTRLRDEVGAFPFVEALCALAADVKAILPDAKISYAADWTEYGAFVPVDGSGDVLFPLDALWSHGAVDFVGIDWYPPMGDWRAVDTHLDRLAGFSSEDDTSYLATQLAGGEAYDWYYADEVARQAQVRTPIADAAHGESWIFRAKDLAGWSGHLHYPRPGGVRAALPTGWTPHQKPVRLTEIGFAAVDKAGNAPNLFVDPKSSESGLPPFSAGTRDDVVQARMLAATLPHFEETAFVDAAIVWAWDARPFPAWPLREDVWGDGTNWARGHWLNGRSGLAPLAEIVAAICAAGGVTSVDTSALEGIVEGFVLSGVASVRAALEPLAAAFGFEAIESGGRLVFRMSGAGEPIEVAPDQLGAAGLSRGRQLMDKSPERLRLTCIDPDRDYQPGIAEARRGDGDARLVLDVTLPLALAPGRADDVAGHLLERAAQRESASVTTALSLVTLEPGDAVSISGAGDWRVESVADTGAERHLTLARLPGALPAVRSMHPGTAPESAVVFPQPDLVVIDAAVPGAQVENGPLIAAFAEPWPGRVDVLAGPDAGALQSRATVLRPAVIGRLAAPAGAGPSGRWDRLTVLDVEAETGAFMSLPDAAVLSGGNAAWLETDEGWELIQFRTADLTGPGRWRLTRLLRGVAGGVSAPARAGARLVMHDDALVRGRLAAMDEGQPLVWKTAGSDALQVLTCETRQRLPWQPTALKVRAGIASWIRRSPQIADNWTFPEAPNLGQFVAEFDAGAGFAGRMEVSEPRCIVPPGTQRLRVAEVGTDGRIGPWLSIGPGSPYL